MLWKNLNWLIIFPGLNHFLLMSSHGFQITWIQIHLDSYTLGFQLAKFQPHQDSTMLISAAGDVRRKVLSNQYRSEVELKPSLSTMPRYISYTPNTQKFIQILTAFSIPQEHHTSITPSSALSLSGYRCRFSAFLVHTSVPYVSTLWTQAL